MTKAKLTGKCKLTSCTAHDPSAPRGCGFILPPFGLEDRPSKPGEYAGICPTFSATVEIAKRFDDAGEPPF